MTSSKPSPDLPPPYEEEKGVLSLHGIGEVSLTLRWTVDAKQDNIDLDASAVLFDQTGAFMESVYFGNLKSVDGSVLHTGDSMTSADTEEIVIKLNQVAPAVRAIVISVSSYSNHSFSAVNTASLQLMARDGRELDTHSLATNAGDHTAVLMGKFFRDKLSGDWSYMKLDGKCHARSFGDMLPIMQETLRPLIPNIVINHSPNIVVLTKGESISVHDTRGAPFRSVVMGLGWDKLGNEPVDLDASCVMFDRQNNQVDVVYFGVLKNRAGTVVHAGDNRTGEGEGDDERVTVDLENLDSKIDSLFFIVNSYSKHPLSRIQNAYVRLLDNATKEEMFRFQLSGSGQSQYTAMLMCKLFRDRGGWSMKALGYGCNGTTYKDNVKEMTRELAGRLKLGDSPMKYTPGGAPAHTLSTTKQQFNNWLAFLLPVLFVLICILLGNRSEGRSSRR